MVPNVLRDNTHCEKKEETQLHNVTGSYSIQYVEQWENKKHHLENNR